MTDGGVKNHTRDIWSAENKVLAFFLLVACLSKLLFLTDISFWLDEQISIAIAMEGPVGCVPAALRFSSHPPSYYCQLGIWTVLSKSDFWIMANAIFLNMVAVLVLFQTTRKRYGLNIALFAALSLALLPQFTYYAANVRMYSWIIIFSVLSWYLTEQVFDTSKKPDIKRVSKLLRWRALCMFLLGYAHGIGPVYAVMQAVYAFWLALGGRDRKVSWKWFWYEAGTGLLLVPAVINSAFRETQHQNTESGSELATLFAQNFASDLIPVSLYGGIAILIAVFTLGLTLIVSKEKQDLKRTLVLIYGQILLFIIISLAWKPILSSRGLVVVLPAFCLLVAVAYSRLKMDQRLKAVLMAGWFGLLGAGSFYVLTEYDKPNDYAGVASDMRNQVQDGDDIYVYAGATHWGMARELLGPDWESPLTVQAPANERWQGLEAALGNYCHTLMICAKRNHYDWQQNRVYVFHNTMKIAPAANRVWLIHNAGQEVAYFEEQLQHRGYQLRYEQNHDAELIRLFEQKAF